METRCWIIADLTKCYPNRLWEPVWAIRTLLSQASVAPSDLMLLGRSDQTEARDEFPQATWAEGTPMTAPPQVGELVRQLSGSGATGNVTVLSYNGQVLRYAAQFGGNGLVVIPGSFRGYTPQQAPLSGYPSMPPHAEPGPATQEWQFEHVAPLEHALATMVEALKRHGHISGTYPCRKTSLRCLMASVDSRFAGNAFSTNSPGMMAALVQIARARHMIEITPDAGLAQNHAVWVNVAAAAANAGGPPTQAATVRPPLASPGATLPDASGALAPFPPAGLALGAPSAPSGDAGPPRRTDDRADQLEKTLSEGGMGPYAYVRARLFDELGRIVAEGGAAQVAKLFHACCRALRELLDSNSETARDRPWTKIEQFYRRLCLSSGVLLDEGGKPIQEGARGLLTDVHRLADGWRVRADAENILPLIAATDDLSLDDVERICGVLYHDRSEDKREQVLRALAHLVEAGRAVEQPSGGRFYFRLAGVQPAGDSPQGA